MGAKVDVTQELRSRIEEKTCSGGAKAQPFRRSGIISVIKGTKHQDLSRMR